MLIDTHCHLDIIVCFGVEPPVLDAGKFAQIKTLIDEAAHAGVKIILNVGCDPVTSYNSIEIAKKFPGVFAVVGMHPYEGKLGWKHDFEQIKQMVKKRVPADKIVGVGEIGLDFSRPESDRAAQKDLFKFQLELGLENNLPFSFHVRDAGEEFLSLIEPYVKQIRGGVVHCFQQNLDFALQATEWNLLLGIDGPITYPKNTYLREIVAQLDLKNLILETDAPFLPVQKERGKINFPAKIPLIAQAVAEIKNLSLEKIAQATSDNAVKLFSLDSCWENGGLTSE